MVVKLLFVCVYVISTGPGLAIRVICAEEPFMEKDFAETNNMLKTIVDYSNAIKKVVFVFCILTGCSAVLLNYK